MPHNPHRVREINIHNKNYSTYINSNPSKDTIVDFVSWDDDGTLSQDQKNDDSNAVSASIWTNDAYVNTGSISRGQTIARDSSSTDTNSVNDWYIRNPTKGSQNP